jgi:hypothetical protein
MKAVIEHPFLAFFARRRAGEKGEDMKTTMLPEHPDAKSPAGADIRFIVDDETGNMIHSTVPPHQVNGTARCKR